MCYQAERQVLRMRKIIFKAAAVFSAVLMAAAAMSSADVVNAADKTITLRICN